MFSPWRNYSRRFLLDLLSTAPSYCTSSHASVRCEEQSNLRREAAESISASPESPQNSNEYGCKAAIL